ncbi:contractile injection system tape measure protein [Paraflavitalea sp. CAU 1676]|uniref:contractile injection system tape measure protein n=1 Tax=Paraflavitalea sp. CAU 1676 TaxID=3032598 RepID=UPI0023DA4C29|nr:contractile injection system tape measure protein [Paraflavitalea sp. CAU 1676]MDF2188603.1 contractile injection system tape measure protein [Paraflavitalea sp. CAU 1676]
MSDPVIHKVSVVLPATDYQEAGRHQSAAKHWARHSLPGLLNRHLESLAKGEEVVYIEKVTIELPDLPWNLSEGDWQRLLAEAIQVSAASPDSKALIVQQWVFYLEHGCMEKHALLASRQAMEVYVAAHFEELGPLLLQTLRSGGTFSMWQRLFGQHGEALVVLVLEALLAIDRARAVRVYAVLRRMIEADAVAAARVLLKLVVTNRAVTASRKEQLLEQLLRGGGDEARLVEPDTDGVSEELIEDAKKPSFPDTYLSCAHAGLVLLFPYIKSFFEHCGFVKEDAFVSEAAQWMAVQALYFLATGKAEGARGVGGEEAAEATSDVVGSVSGGEEASDAADGVPEEELVLPKLLCGVELSDYVEWKGALPAFVQREANALLEAVIDHWKVLQHTSVDGFRETFLRRTGQLVRQGDNYTLQVEESGVDILLNSIPWGFRNYRLPWMPGTLVTEWS